MRFGTKWFAPLAVALALWVLDADAFVAQTSITPRGEAQNVRFELREDGIVHIFYDLISSDPRAVFSVQLEASQDSGTTFGLKPQSTSGDTGDGVRPGTGKRIVWDSGKDVERVQIDLFRFRIVATGAPLAVEAPQTAGASAAPKPNPVPPPSAAAPPANKGSGIKWLLIGGGGAAAAAGVAVAAGGGGDGGTTASSGSDSLTLVSLSPPSGSTLRSLTDVVVTLNYNLVSQARAVITVAPVRSSPSNGVDSFFGSSTGPEVTRGSGTVVVVFFAGVEGPGTGSVTSDRLVLEMQSIPNGSSPLVRNEVPATYTWTRP
jgi:hypothetical protein